MLSFTIYIFLSYPLNLCTAKCSATNKHPKALAFGVGNISACYQKQKFEEQDFNFLQKSKIIRRQRGELQLTHLFPQEASQLFSGTSATSFLSKLFSFLMCSHHQICNHMKWAVEILLQTEVGS